MLTVERLTKKFSNGKGIFDVSFHVQKGEVFGFLGPNGAGKINNHSTYHGVYEA